MGTLRHGRAHDYAHLIRRWRGLARRARLKIVNFAEAGGYELFYLENRIPPAADSAPALCFSAGIHGDEVGATEGLLEWAEKHEALLANLKVVIFPCLNPWGIVNNNRLDAEGRDLNRDFRLGRIPQVAAQMRVLAGRRFDLALTLHEDYDAQGMYLYEVVSRKPYWGEMLLEAEKQIPPDPRGRIEGRVARAGVMRAKITPDSMSDWPEAIFLHFQHAERTFTLESPSEFSLDHRAAALRKMISRAVALCREEVRARATSI